MCLVGDYERRRLDPVKVPAYSLDHIHTAQIHVDTLPQERLGYLLTQLLPVDEELYPVPLRSG